MIMLIMSSTTIIDIVHNVTLKKNLLLEPSEEPTPLTLSFKLDLGLDLRFIL